MTLVIAVSVYVVAEESVAASPVSRWHLWSPVHSLGLGVLL